MFTKHKIILSWPNQVFCIVLILLKLLQKLTNHDGRNAYQNCKTLVAQSCDGRTLQIHLAKGQC